MLPTIAQVAHRPSLPFALAFVLLVAGCSHIAVEPTPDTATGSDGRSVLRVALFPWIPDAAGDGFAALRRNLESEFERRHPDVDLEIRLKPWDDSYYSPAKIAGWLAGGEFDLVEIDTVILGDLVEAEVIEPWPPQDASTFFRAAVDGASIVANPGGDRTWWGVPHLMCGYFLVSQSDRIDGAPSIDEVTSAVREDGRPLLGNFDSSWDLPSLYLDARVDNGFDPADLRRAVEPPLDPATAGAVEKLAALCARDGQNPCVDGTYSDAWDGPVEAFVAGDASGYWGYSERLHLTVKSLRENPAAASKVRITDLRIATLPLGSEATPLLFTDALVRRRGCGAEGSCRRASVAFAEFMNSDWANRQVLLSGDAASIGEAAVPRYLLPATRAAFDIDAIRDDPTYAELREFADSGRALPNDGELYERRRVLAWLLVERLKASQAPTETVRPAPPPQGR
ncbi:MAG: hypothetical protein AAGM22_23425 [Acidobacteriota bacterium]